MNSIKTTRNYEEQYKNYKEQYGNYIYIDRQIDRDRWRQIGKDRINPPIPSIPQYTSLSSELRQSILNILDIEIYVPQQLDKQIDRQIERQIDKWIHCRAVVLGIDCLDKWRNCIAVVLGKIVFIKGETAEH